MSNHDITLTLADVDAITAGSAVTVAVEPGLVYEVTSEQAWTASPDPGVIRFGLSPGQLDRLWWGRMVTVLPVGGDGLVYLTVDLTEVAR